MYHIELDEQLVKEAMAVSGEKSQKETIHTALRNYIRIGRRREILHYQGKGIWEGNLDEMRTTR
jgi:Arc/MetJ family transcription regulator